MPVEGLETKTQNFSADAMTQDFRADTVKAQIQRLFADCPELREDDEALVLSLESETDTIEMCQKLMLKCTEIEHFIEAVKNWKKQLDERQGMLERRGMAYRGTLIQIMETARLPNLPMPLGTLFLRRTRHVIITDQDALPEVYRRVKVEPNKQMIAAAMKDGNHVPGAVFSNPEPSLTIRTK